MALTGSRRGEGRRSRASAMAELGVGGGHRIRALDVVTTVGEEVVAVVRENVVAIAGEEVVTVIGYEVAAFFGEEVVVVAREEMVEK
jgi:hypothetical protein